jgi:GTP-binding protein EngB required for normal cell division
MGKFVKVSSSC